jgi:non-canonical poly(A) RNA polymerase PAPD5/7
MSRPAGLPPKPPPGDSWRPEPPREPQTQFTSGNQKAESYRRHDEMYQFRGNDYPNREENRAPTYSYNPSPRRYDAPPGVPTGDSYRPTNGFNFTSQPPPSIDLSRMSSDTYRPQSITSNGHRSDHRYDRANAPTGPGRQRQRGGGTYRGRTPWVKTADRPMLHTSRQRTPELMPGMIEEKGNIVKYLAVEDLSDSDEADMDVSDDDDSENGESEAPVQPKKKQARLGVNQSKDGDSVPRWSNPDPYSVLPPTDESQRKTKDVVKLIRKARVVEASEETPKVETEADDFISFDLGDDEDGHVSGTDDESGLGVTGAPTGPRAYSHRDSIHQILPPTEVKNKNGISQTIDKSSDPSLGNRKRNFDDEIKGPPLGVKKSGGKKPPARGMILKEWTCPEGSNPTPWCKIDNSHTTNMGNL